MMNTGLAKKSIFENKIVNNYSYLRREKSAFPLNNDNKQKFYV